MLAAGSVTTVAVTVEFPRITVAFPALGAEDAVVLPVGDGRVVMGEDGDVILPGTATVSWEDAGRTAHGARMHARKRNAEGLIILA